ncbi:MFS transporter [Lichenicoccus sp.]|uniref:MFS transporter n=1 Tax=Lichenicoccus sp. TaxID=2781899 RepID=UPI003D0D74D3
MRAAPRWIACYAILGLVQSGMVPIILPLAAAPGPTSGFTYAAFAASGVAAPFVGAWSDRHRRHRATLVAGLILAALASFAHALPGDVSQHMLSAAAIGLGVSSASTVATMFIVEVEPQTQWDGLIGILQAFMSGGQLLGLLLAGVLGLRHTADALVLCGVLLLLAVPVALRYAPDPVVVVSRPELRPRPPRSGDAAAIGAQRQFHRITREAIAGLAHSGLAWFLGSWLLSYTATNGLSVMIAVVMVRSYGSDATLPTTAYAIGVGLSLLLYSRVASWDTRLGAWKVMRAGLAIRAVLVALMLALSFDRGSVVVLPLLACFAATQVVWPLLSVSSTALAVTLSPARRAESVGLLNASSSLGATVGGIAAGLLLSGGFALLCATVLGALLIALVLAYHPHVRLRAPQPA